MQKNKQKISCVRFSPNCPRSLITAGSDGRVILWDVSTRKEVSSLNCENFAPTTNMVGIAVSTKSGTGVAQCLHVEWSPAASLMSNVQSSSAGPAGNHNMNIGGSINSNVGVGSMDNNDLVVLGFDDNTLRVWRTAFPCPVTSYIIICFRLPDKVEGGLKFV